MNVITRYEMGDGLALEFNVRSGETLLRDPSGNQIVLGDLKDPDVQNDALDLANAIYAVLGNFDKPHAQRHTEQEIAA